MCLYAQSCLTLCNPMDFRLPACSVHGILQARMFKWVAVSYSRGSSWPQESNSSLAGGFFTTEPPGRQYILLAFWNSIMSIVMRENTSDRGYSIPRSSGDPIPACLKLMSRLDKKDMSTLPELKERVQYYNLFYICFTCYKEESIMLFNHFCE